MIWVLVIGLGLCAFGASETGYDAKANEGGVLIIALGAIGALAWALWRIF